MKYTLFTFFFEEKSLDRNHRWLSLLLIKNKAIFVQIDSNCFIFETAKAAHAFEEIKAACRERDFPFCSLEFENNSLTGYFFPDVDGALRKAGVRVVNIAPQGD